MTVSSPAASNVVLDVGVQLALEVGRAQMTIRELLALKPGSVIELGRPAGDPLDVYVNERLVAHGEVVMVNDRYGVRFTDAVGSSRRPTCARSWA
ncbi:MAG: flagellar motor switch protein FliN [Steroidobacteraceae bacterium]